VQSQHGDEFSGGTSNVGSMQATISGVQPVQLRQSRNRCAFPVVTGERLTGGRFGWGLGETVRLQSFLDGHLTDPLPAEYGLIHNSHKV
jgi:hypothetical protein